MSCPHRRVRALGEARFVKGPPPADVRPGDEKLTGFHVSQSGVCLDCGFPVLRTSAHAILGAWGTVAEDARPSCKYRRDRQRYGTGRDEAA